MLREEGGRVRESPLPVKGKALRCMLTIVGRSLQRPTMFPTIFGYRGFQRWCCLLASRISPAIVRVSSLTTTADGVYLAVSSAEVGAKIGLKK